MYQKDASFVGLCILCISGFCLRVVKLNGVVVLVHKEFLAKAQVEQCGRNAWLPKEDPPLFANGRLR